jgi:hypothetical protein
VGAAAAVLLARLDLGFAALEVLAGHGLSKHAEAQSLSFMKIATHLRRSCFLQSFSVVFLYYFYVIS